MMFASLKLRMATAVVTAQEKARVAATVRKAAPHRCEARGVCVSGLPRLVRLESARPARGVCVSFRKPVSRTKTRWGLREKRIPVARKRNASRELTA